MNTYIYQIIQTGCCMAAIAALLASCYYKPTEVNQQDPGTTSVTYSPGYVVRTLPSGYETRVVRGTTYYSYGNTYFRPQGRGYVVVDVP